MEEEEEGGYYEQQFEDPDRDTIAVEDQKKDDLEAALDQALIERAEKAQEIKAKKDKKAKETATATSAPVATSSAGSSSGPGMRTNSMKVCTCGGIVFDCATTANHSTTHPQYIPVKPAFGPCVLSLVTDTYSNAFDYAFPNYPNLSKLLDLDDPRAKFLADIYFTVHSSIPLHTILDVPSMYSEYADYDDINAHPLTRFAIHGCALANLVDATTRKDICMDHTTDSCICSVCHSIKVTTTNPLQICSVCCYSTHLECIASTTHTPASACGDWLCYKCRKGKEETTTSDSGKGKSPNGRRGRSKGRAKVAAESTGAVSMQTQPMVNVAVPLPRQHLAAYRSDNIDIDCKLAQYVCPWYGHSPFSWSQQTKKYIANRKHPLFDIYKSMIARVWKDDAYKRNGIMVALMWTGTYGSTPTYRSIDKYAWFSYAYCSSRFIGARPMFGMPSSSCFSTDRINVWGHYELGNIRWLDESGQMSNQQKDYSMHARNSNTKPPSRTRSVRLSINIPASAPSSSVREMVRAAVHTSDNMKPPELRLSVASIDRSKLRRACTS